MNETRLLAINIELRKHHMLHTKEYFNSSMLGALLSGLSVAYQEAFIWSVDHHIGVWVVGSDPGLLIQAFIHQKEKYTRMTSYDGALAYQFFGDVLSGSQWKDCSAQKKYKSLVDSSSLAVQHQSMRDQLVTIVQNGIYKLSTPTIIEGGKNSWHKNEEHALQYSPIKKKEVRDVLYRFCIN